MQGTCDMSKSNSNKEVIKTNEFGDIVIVKDNCGGDCRKCILEEMCGDDCNDFEDKYNLGDCAYSHHYERYIPPEKKKDDDVITFPGVDGEYKIADGLYCQLKLRCGCGFPVQGYIRVDKELPTTNIIKTINLGDHLGLVDVVKGGGCGNCYLFDLYNNCTYGDCGRFELCKRVTGLDCTELSGFGGHLIEHKVPKTEKWIQCTPENICVGDVVRRYTYESIGNIKYVMALGSQFVIQYGSNGAEMPKLTRDYEKMIKE